MQQAGEDDDDAGLVDEDDYRVFGVVLRWVAALIFGLELSN